MISARRKEDGLGQQEMKWSTYKSERLGRKVQSRKSDY